MSKNESCCITKDEGASLQDYWDANYKKNDNPNWVELQSPWVMPWIESLNLEKDAAIFCAGVGNANIVESLLKQGFTNIIANDISQVVLDKLSNKLGNKNVTYLKDDLIHPSIINNYNGKIDLYIDRATLHFFTKCPEKDHYFQQMRSLLKPNGHSIIGVFSKENAPKCCGLNLQLWSIDSLKNRLTLYNHLDESNVAFEERNGNIRNYIYLLSQKLK